LSRRESDPGAGAEPIAANFIARSRSSPLSDLSDVESLRLQTGRKYSRSHSATSSRAPLRLRDRETEDDELVIGRPEELAPGTRKSALTKRREDLVTADGDIAMKDISDFCPNTVDTDNFYAQKPEKEKRISHLHSLEANDVDQVEAAEDELPGGDSGSGEEPQV
jgi:hypothetical protein